MVLGAKIFIAIMGLMVFPIDKHKMFFKFIVVISFVMQLLGVVINFTEAHLSGLNDKMYFYSLSGSQPVKHLYMLLNKKGIDLWIFNNNHVMVVFSKFVYV